MPKVPLQRPQQTRVIYLHPHAPAKPAEGAACNGCGVCCAAEPCPLGILVTGRLQGACRALQWRDGPPGLYRCGLVSTPTEVLRWLPMWAAPTVSGLARRWISSASGCDASLKVDG